MTRVAIQGVQGSYSEGAVRELFGAAATLVECGSFEETFDAVRSGSAENAVVPVENKIVGEIRRPVELMRGGTFRVLDMLSLRVQHVLVGTTMSEVSSLSSVRSHFEALKQCRKFLVANPHMVPVTGADTASSIRRIVTDGDPANGAIGSARAAELYGAKILMTDVADDINNWTTFYVIGK